MMKKIIYAAAVAGAVICYTKLSDSKKRFYKGLIRQVPYLIPRYFV
jgi:hypothetical protein